MKEIPVNEAISLIIEGKTVYVEYTKPLNNQKDIMYINGASSHLIGQLIEPTREELQYIPMCYFKYGKWFIGE